jgi:short-subunit dehydrogenase
MKLAQKTILVTGAGNGMGRELVLQLLQREARVAAVDVNASALEETRQLAGKSAIRLSLHTLNISDKAAVEALPQAVLMAHGNIDGLINCAGIIQPFVKVNALDYESIERVMHVNFYGTLYLTKAALPYLLQRPEAHILNVSSMGGFLPVPGQAIYGASKAAVKLFTEALYTELLDTSVRVTIVFPGAIGTNIAQNSGVADSLKITPEMQKKAPKTLPADRAAKLMLDGMEANQLRVLIGNDARFLDKLYRLAPTFAARFIYKQMKSLLG